MALSPQSSGISMPDYLVKATMLFYCRIAGMARVGFGNIR